MSSGVISVKMGLSNPWAVLVYAIWCFCSSNSVS